MTVTRDDLAVVGVQLQKGKPAAGHGYLPSSLSMTAMGIPMRFQMKDTKEGQCISQYSA
jgi:hypothetical protein